MRQYYGKKKNVLNLRNFSKNNHPFFNLSGICMIVAVSIFKRWSTNNLRVKIYQPQYIYIANLLVLEKGVKKIIRRATNSGIGIGCNRLLGLQQPNYYMIEAPIRAFSRLHSNSNRQLQEISIPCGGLEIWNPYNWLSTWPEQVSFTPRTAWGTLPNCRDPYADMAVIWNANVIDSVQSQLM